MGWTPTNPKNEGTLTLIHTLTHFLFLSRPKLFSYPFLVWRRRRRLVRVRPVTRININININIKSLVVSPWVVALCD